MVKDPCISTDLMTYIIIAKKIFDKRNLGTHMAIEIQCVSAPIGIGCVSVIRPVYNLAYSSIYF